MRVDLETDRLTRLATVSRVDAPTHQSGERRAARRVEQRVGRVGRVGTGAGHRPNTAVTSRSHGRWPVGLVTMSGASTATTASCAAYGARKSMISASVRTDAEARTDRRVDDSQSRARPPTSGRCLRTPASISSPREARSEYAARTPLPSRGFAPLPVDKCQRRRHVSGCTQSNLLDIDERRAPARPSGSRLVDPAPAAELKDARVTPDRVAATVMTTTVLVGRPDGQVFRLLDVLEGQTLTHRVAAATPGRTDLWTNLSPNRSTPTPGSTHCHWTGGELTAAVRAPRLIGPSGWLPDVPAGDLIGLRVENGQVQVLPLPDGVDATPEREQEVRATLPGTSARRVWSTSEPTEAEPTAPSGTLCSRIRAFSKCRSARS